jgi:hypothetical protein
MSLLTSLLTNPLTFETTKLENTVMFETPKVIVGEDPSMIERVTNGHMLVCAICGDSADGAHFGCDSCRAW